MARKTTKAPKIGKMQVRIDGETFDVRNVRDLGNGIAELDVDGNMQFVVAPDSETAGKASRARWADMAENDPAEFRCMVGDENLVKWALGQYAGPGSTQVDSLEDWLDLHLNVPEEEFASYDGLERDVDAAGPEVVEELGFTPTVAYRHN